MSVIKSLKICLPPSLRMKSRIGAITVLKSGLSTVLIAVVSVAQTSSPPIPPGTQAKSVKSPPRLTFQVALASARPVLSVAVNSTVMLFRAPSMELSTMLVTSSIRSWMVSAIIG